MITVPWKCGYICLLELHSYNNVRNRVTIYGEHEYMYLVILLNICCDTISWPTNLFGMSLMLKLVPYIGKSVNWSYVKLVCCFDEAVNVYIVPYIDVRFWIPCMISVAVDRHVSYITIPCITCVSNSALYAADYRNVVSRENHDKDNAVGGTKQLLNMA